MAKYKVQKVALGFVPRDATVSTNGQACSISRMAGSPVIVREDVEVNLLITGFLISVVKVASRPFNY